MRWHAVPAGGLVALTLIGCDEEPTLIRPSLEVLPLTRVANRQCDDAEGWSNLFFEGDSADATEVVARFAAPQAGSLVEIVRRGDPGGSPRYTTRVAGQESQAPLEFEPMERGSCSTTEVSLPGMGTPVRIQVAISDRWVYGRVAEHREGVLVTPAESVHIEVQARTRNGLRFNELSGVQLFVDQDGDGRVRRRSELGPSGRTVLVGDAVGQRFKVDDAAFEVLGLSDGGADITLRRVEDAPAPFRGFKSPDLIGTKLDGTPFRLGDSAGRVVILEFWSTECPFSERARPDAQLLAAQLQSGGGRYISIARESDIAAVRKHVEENPRGGTLLVGEESTWRSWNPETVTPLYYVISPEGQIRLREAGAAAVRLAAVMADVPASVINPEER